MAKRNSKAGKGVFGDPALPVAGAYPKSKRRQWLAAAGVLALIALILAASDALLDRRALISNGPLSSAHANLGNDCAACHTPFGEVEDAACQSCHERAGDELGVYSFAAHYLYRTTDFQRVVPSPEETSCAGCHTEHGGRHASITHVPDNRCESCHGFSSFADGHPDFDALAGDHGALEFAHAHHVAEVMDFHGLAGIEDACLACHRPQADGRSFEPLEFERHCGACHLTTSVRTEPLPIAAASDEPGVETLEMIQQRGGPAARWAYFVNPNEFRQLGGAVVKGPLYHEDPWVLENLRQIRRRLYPQARLADLLQTTADVPPDELPTLYREASAQLREAALSLRGRPEAEVQSELARIDAALDHLERRLEDPFAPVDETRFVLDLGPRNPELEEGEAEALEELATRLAGPCLQCHRLENATVARVRADQRVLGRAEFDHRAHVVQLGCLDCHTKIPIAELLEAGDPPLTSEVDRAAIQNLPSQDRCLDCHTPRLAADTCGTCHLFHPDPTRRANLRRPGAAAEGADDAEAVEEPQA